MGPDAVFGIALGAAMTAVWTWWAWQEGAFFGSVFYPGAIVLYLALIGLVLWAPWNGDLSLSRGARIALAALLLLGAWTAVSALWTPAPDIALADAQRVFLYAASFALGLWLCHLAGRRMELSLLPLALAAALVGLATGVVFLTGDEPSRYLEIDGTLEFPLGYRNANAAFFLIALWPAISLASSPEMDWRLRGAMLGTASLCLELAYLSQSRGSALAFAPALFLWLVFSPWRLRAALWLALAAAGAAIAVPWLSDVYDAAGSAAPVLDALREAGAAILITFAGAVIVGAIVARLEPGRRPSRRPGQPLWRALAVGLGTIVLATAAVLVATGTNPADWVGQRADEFRTNTSPELSAQQTRFGVNASSERGDLWRVALGEAGDNPVLGQGPGSYGYSYLIEGRTGVTPRDAHSVEMELLSELGVPGLLLFAAAFVGATLALLQTRRLGPGAAGLAAAAAAGGGYWLAHASIDWFWTYPAITAPAIALVGAASAPAMLRAKGPVALRGARLVVAAAAVLALVAVPFFLSERYIDNAYDGWRGDLERAYDDLDAARSLNPFSVDPLLAEGAIAREAGDRERALAAFRSATADRPEEWGSYYFIALLLARDQPDAAADALATAAELNPDGERVERLEARLERGSGDPQATAP